MAFAIVVGVQADVPLKLSDVARSEWQPQVVLTVPVQFPAMAGGKQIGTATFPAGTSVSVIGVEGENLIVSYQTYTARVPATMTDFLARVATRRRAEASQAKTQVDLARQSAKQAEKPPPVPRVPWTGQATDVADFKDMPPAELKAKAEKGEANAQARLGVCYIRGDGVAQDCAEAVKWFRKAAEQGNARGEYRLGKCYFNGDGVPQDYAEAAKWWRRAAEQGYAVAQNNLGSCYHDGVGVPKDYAEAVKWWRKAAEQGYAIARQQLGNLYYLDKSTSKVISAEAQSPISPSAITGAFGLKLGSTVDLSQYKKKDDRSKEDASFEFTPQNPVEGLTEYYFTVTPKTGIICFIGAAGKFPDKASCERQQAVIFDFLQKKYGPESKPEGFDGGFAAGFNGRQRIDQGSRAIVIQRDVLSDSLLLIYMDFDLREQAKKERIEIDKKKTNGSGL